MKEIICNKIIALRKRNAWSQVDLADLLHMSQNAYSELESGKRKIDIERLQAIANIFKVNLQYFFEDISPHRQMSD